MNTRKKYLIFIAGLLIIFLFTGCENANKSRPSSTNFSINKYIESSDNLIYNNKLFVVQASNIDDDTIIKKLLQIYVLKMGLILLNLF